MHTKYGIQQESSQKFVDGNAVEYRKLIVCDEDVQNAKSTNKLVKLSG